jgi:hypothetical protein
VMALGSSGDVERPEREDSPPPSRAVCRLLRRSATSPGRGPVVPTLVESCLRCQIGILLRAIAWVTD